MAEFILNKVLLVIFIMSVFNCLKHVWNVIDNLREPIPSKYQVTPKERFLLGLSLAYIISSFFTGIQL
jgi:hypothetical protein